MSAESTLRASISNHADDFSYDRRTGFCFAWVKGEHYVWAPSVIRRAAYRCDLSELFDDKYCQTEGMHAARTGMML